MPIKEKSTERVKATEHRTGDHSQPCRECGEPTRNADRYHYGCTPMEIYLGALFR